MRKKVDLNVDIAEGFPFDSQLLEFATSANVCLGAHAGSEELAMATIEQCLTKKVRVGLHPGYPDRESMGRQSPGLAELRSWLQSVYDQTTKFCRIVQAAYVKPHGAFYNDTAIPLPRGWDEDPADAPPRSRYQAGGAFLANTAGVQTLVMLMRINRIAIMGLQGTAHQEVARRANVAFFREGFADRRYLPGGTLAPRTQPDAVLKDPDEIKSQILRLAPTVDSICIHGDTPGCLEFAQLVVKTLKDSGYVVGA